MSKELIAKAAEVIKSETAEWRDGTCTLALIDEAGYPTASTMSVIKSKGIGELKFSTGLDSNKARRIQKCNRASVCLNSSNYNITLVGTIEILTDPKTKKEMWNAYCEEYWTGPDDPDFCVLRFTTERYNLWLGTEGAEGIL
ncbi:MAG: pyridoxamine 5'-phosphate oxidase family protein [Oscillospiraceae bacterium]|nr:pyridoxamine 5'-phosphate oxidase family protein [Oscillospiraceae bacterium]